MNMSSGTETEAHVVTENADGEATQILVDVPQTPEAEPQTPENSERVALAEIESETAIELATIHADTERHRVEVQEEGNELWQTEMTHLRERLDALGETVVATAAVVESLLPPLIPQPSELEPETITVEVDPTTVSSETTPETSSQTPTEPPEKDEDERPVVEVVVTPGAPKHRVRMI